MLTAATTAIRSITRTAVTGISWTRLFTSAHPGRCARPDGLIIAWSVVGVIGRALIAGQRDSRIGLKTPARSLECVRLLGCDYPTRCAATNADQQCRWPKESPQSRAPRSLDFCSDFERPSKWVLALGCWIDRHGDEGLDDSQRYGHIRIASNGSLIPDRYQAIGQRCCVVRCPKTSGMGVIGLYDHSLFVATGATFNLVVTILFVKRLECLRRYSRQIIRLV
jgi:hypothetical protein